MENQSAPGYFLIGAGYGHKFQKSLCQEKRPLFMSFIWNRKHLLAIVVDGQSIINLYFYRLAHVIKLNPILSWLSYLWNSIFLGVYFFPNRLFIIGVNEISKFYNLQLGSYPDSLLSHKFLNLYIAHFNVFYFDGALLFWFLLFTFFLIFRCLFSFLRLIF